MMKNLLQNTGRQAAFYLVAVLLALTLKQYYSRACPEDLEWILKPTAGLVSSLCGDTFRFEAGKGYVCDDRRVIIAPACAGVNFMLMAFGMAVFAGLPHMRGTRHGLTWLVFSLPAAYGLTLAVNALRILVSIHTLSAGTFAGGLAWERVHRLEGVVIYFFFQYLFYSMIQKTIRIYKAGETVAESPVRFEKSSGRKETIRGILLKGVTPCAWYLGVTLAVPLLNGAAGRYGNRFYEHAAMVLGLCLAAWTGIIVSGLCGRWMRLLFSGGLSKQ